VTDEGLRADCNDRCYGEECVHVRDARRAAEGRVRWSHDCKGRVLEIRPGLTVVPYEQTRGGWYAVVAESDDTEPNRAYPRGGYNILVFDDDVERARERGLS